MWNGFGRLGKSMKHGDLVRMMPTWDMEKNYPSLVNKIGLCLELKPCPTYEGEHLALIHLPGSRPKWWPLGVWGKEDVLVIGGECE